MRIRRLDPDVIHKMAAGEIIIGPSNALKEILDNSIDAGASKIEVVVKEGGFKLLQVTDNGLGINCEDLPNLCERFATSKLRSINDLSTLSTLGFRGEALASISHISHLSVVTKTAEDQLATMATYESGKLVNTQPQAGLQGTQIRVENLFYNVPSRLAAMKNRAADEYQRILDIVTKYAIYYPGSFSCKKYGDTQYYVIAGNSPAEKIRRVYGASVSDNLIEIKIPSHPEYGLECVDGYITGANYVSKKAIGCIFFVDGRLVACDALRRELQKTLAMFMPKGSNAFVFLSLKIAAGNVDVNMHPTKHDVNFLYQPEIVDLICAHTSKVLETTNTTRTLSTQLYISSTCLTKNSPHEQQPRYEYKLVRTDPKQQVLSQYLKFGSQKPADPPVDDCTLMPTPQSNDAEHLTSSFPEQLLTFEPTKLASISHLKLRVQKQADEKLTRLFSNHTYVGVADPAKLLVAVQYELQLYLVDAGVITRELFYQIGLSDFANFGTIHLGDGLPVSDLLKLAKVQNANLQPLLDMSDMLCDYFRIKFKVKDEAVFVVQMPLLLQHYIPSLARYPAFFAKLLDVDWVAEEKCLHAILQALAELYVPTEGETDLLALILTASKRRLVATIEMRSSVVEIANLPGLYRVFERC